MIHAVVLTKEAKKGLKDAPPQAVRKLQLWILHVETQGLEATRKVRGFDDHTLKGQRRGQRAIRLTRQ